MSNACDVAALFRAVALAGLLAGVALRAGAQAVPDVERVTEALVAEALAANLVLDQQAANVDQRLAVLDQVRAGTSEALLLRVEAEEGHTRKVEVGFGEQLDCPADDVLLARRQVGDRQLGLHRGRADHCRNGEHRQEAEGAEPMTGHACYRAVTSVWRLCHVT